MDKETTQTDAPTGKWKIWLKRPAIGLLKLLCLVYTMKFLWRSITNFWGLLKGMSSQNNVHKAESNRAGMLGESSYECYGCGRKIAVGRYVCPYCAFGETSASEKGNSKGCFYCIFMLPFNLAMVIITALPILLILAAIGGAMSK